MCRHFKMDYLVRCALLEGKQRYSIPLYPDTSDLEAFSALKTIQTSINDFVNNGNNLLYTVKFVETEKLNGLRNYYYHVLAVFDYHRF